jgi:glycerol-3-phosphate acyltransferase PlsY
VLTALVIIASYLVGSIPTGDIVGRLNGVDIRKIGSGNPGFTNVLRELGPRAGVPVLVVDVAKGLVAVLVFGAIVGAGSGLGPVGIRLAAGLAAVAGHIWSVFTRFKGGKGVATACGMFLALAPLGTAAAILVWGVLVAATRYVSLGSITAAVFLPWAIWLEARATGGTVHVSVLVTACAVAAAVVVRHRANIRRLLAGTENRFTRSAGEGEAR